MTTPDVGQSVDDTSTRETGHTAIGLSGRAQVVIFFLAAALVVSRRPDALLNPQFFAEDGTTWFPQAYMMGWFSALFHTDAGYFQTLPRLAAALALLVPFRFAPLLENVIAIAIQVLPVSLLLSERCQRWGSLPLRAAMAFLYIALPNSFEMDASMEEAQWHLALILCIVVLSSLPKITKWRLFDISAVLIGGLSGPFTLMLLPIATVFWWRRRERWRLIVLTILAITSAIQLIALFGIIGSGRQNVDLGATPGLFVRLVARDVYLRTLFGQNATPDATKVVLSLIAIAGTGFIVWCFWRAPLEWKLFLIFGACVFAASLYSSAVPFPQWRSLDLTPGIRYWFFPTLAFAWVILWALFSRGRYGMRVVAGLLALTISVAVVKDWRYPPFINYRFRDYARWFRMAPAGAMVLIPINPAGWMMRITKRAPLCSTLPTGAIEQPAFGSHITTQPIVSGTVRSAEEIRRVSIYIDRRLVQSIKPVGAARSQHWATVLDTSQISSGPHEMEVRAEVGSKGCQADIGVALVYF